MRQGSTQFNAKCMHSVEMGHSLFFFYIVGQMFWCSVQNMIIILWYWFCAPNTHTYMCATHTCAHTHTHTRKSGKKKIFNNVVYCDVM